MKELDANELITGVINTFTLKVERYNGNIESELNATDPVSYTHLSGRMVLPFLYSPYQ